MLFVLLLVLAAGFFVKQRSQERPEENIQPNVELEKTNLPLFTVADSANMVMIASVGLGREERRKVISGRLYQNFVQLLKTNGSVDNQESFSENCKEGVRLEFFRDTISLGNFRMTDRIGRVGVPGVWKPDFSHGDEHILQGESGAVWKRLKMVKVSNFLKKQGVQFTRCDHSSGAEVSMSAVPEKQKPVLSMPKFGADRKTRGGKKRGDALDSIMNNAKEMASLPQSASNEIQQFLNSMDEMIFPADTAVGEPLSVLASRCNRVDVSFYDSGKIKKLVKTVSMTDDQVVEFRSLLSRTSRETFDISGDLLYVLNAKMTLYRDSVAEMELWVVFDEYNSLVKCPVRNGVCLEHKGFWSPANPAAVKSFLDKFRE